VDLLRVRLVVEDFPAALRFYATMMDGACVTKAPDGDAALIWTGRKGAEIELLSTEVAGDAPGITFVCFTDDVDAAVEVVVRAGGEVVEGRCDVAPGATRYARARTPDGYFVEITKPQVPSWGRPTISELMA
jgi:predicted enzyme related to lactoylglutathione lyase